METAEATALRFIQAWQSGNWEELRGPAGDRDFVMSTPIDDTEWKCRWVATWTSDRGWFQCFRPWKGDRILWVMVARGSSEVHDASSTLPPENMDGFEELGG